MPAVILSTTTLTHIYTSNTNHTHRVSKATAPTPLRNSKPPQPQSAVPWKQDSSIRSLVGKKPRSCAKQLPEQRPKGQKTLSRRAQTHYSVLDPQHNLCCGTPQQQQTARVTEHDQHASTNMHTTRCTGHPACTACKASQQTDVQQCATYASNVLGARVAGGQHASVQGLIRG